MTLKHPHLRPGTVQKLTAHQCKYYITDKTWRTILKSLKSGQVDLSQPVIIPFSTLEEVIEEGLATKVLGPEWAGYLD
jgi:hypothetical protein